MLLNLALCYKERQTASSRMNEKKHKNIKKEQESWKKNSLQNICGGQNA